MPQLDQVTARRVEHARFPPDVDYTIRMLGPPGFRHGREVFKIPRWTTPEDERRLALLCLQDNRG